MKIQILLYFISFALFINGCCDCNTNPVNNTNFECLIREATITEFNADLVKVDTILKPGTYYSIHNFVFPDNKYFTGTLINDERFAKTGEVIVSSQNFSNTSSFKIAILDNNPTNGNMIGDILVDTVFTNLTSADLKFKGDLARLDSGFLNDDAELFCEYIEFNSNFISGKAIELSKYGKDVRNSRVPKIFNNSDIRILNSENENVTSQTGTPIPSNEDVNSLLNKVNSENVVVNVKPGETFLYRSYSGGLFVVLISNIANGQLPPNKGRVTIMFNKIG